MLTDIRLKAVKPAERPFRLPDTGGLHLFVTPAGGKLWRLRYKLPGGKEKLLSFGSYPKVTLAQARQKRDEAKAHLGAGTDPAAMQKQGTVSAGGITFGDLGNEWWKLQKPRWKPIHANDVIDSLTNLVFPTLGARSAAGITVPEVLECLRKIEARPAVETARRVRQRMSAVFCYGVATGRLQSDPAAIVKGAMAPVIRRPQPAVTTLAGCQEVLAKIEATPSVEITRTALKLLALTVVRPGELRGAVWPEFQLDGELPTWTIPAGRMKMKREHVVPLSRQAVALLLPLDRDTLYIFPNARQPTKPMSENALGYLLNRAGYHHRHVPHGWRAAFSTIMNEEYPEDRFTIDMMLAHQNGNAVEGAYNRAKRAPRRRELAQIWADMLMPSEANPAERITEI